MDRTTRLVMRADAVFDFGFGVLMLLSPWAGDLFRLLDLPAPRPEFYTQLAGGLLVVCAYLLWIAPTNTVLARPIALAVGQVNALGVLLIAAWLISEQLGVGRVGTVILLAALAALAIFSLFELRFARAGQP